MALTETFGRFRPELSAEKGRLLGAAALLLVAAAAVAASECIVLRLREKVFAHVQLLSPVAHRKRGVGDLVVRHSADLEAVEHLVASGLLSIAVAAVNIAGLLIAAFWMNPIVAGVALAAAPLLWAISRTFSRHQMRVTRDEREANSDIADAITSALTGHETTVAYNQQGREAQALRHSGRRWARARIGETRLESGFGAVLGFAEVVVTLLVTMTGVWQVRTGNLTVGQLLALTGYLAMLYPKLQDLAEMRLTFAATAVSAERIAELLDEPAHFVDAPGAAAPSLPGRELRAEGVSFSRGDRTVLDDLDLTLKPGAVTALVGPSGAGKSTLAALLTKMETPDRGRILLDGHDVANLTGTSVRDRVTLLPQTPTIKTGSVADNIAYGRPEATRAQVVAAAKDAGAHAFIGDLPQGYDTELAADGLELSGGQRQRIAIARAIVRDTPLLVLDEPSAALDDASVTEIMVPLRRLAEGRTTLLITHDPRVLTIADTTLTLTADGSLRELVDTERVVDDGAEVEHAVTFGDTGDEGVVDALGFDVVHNGAVEVEGDHPNDVLRARAETLGNLGQDLAGARRQLDDAL